MSIITTLDNAAEAWDLQSRSDWTYPEFQALFNYMDERSNEMGEQVEFDPIAWVCEYSFGETAAAYCEDCHADQYAELVEENKENEGDEDSLEQICFNYLSRSTTVVYSNGPRGIVVEDF